MKNLFLLFLLVSTSQAAVYPWPGPWTVSGVGGSGTVDTNATWAAIQASTNAGNLQLFLQPLGAITNNETRSVVINNDVEINGTLRVISTNNTTTVSNLNVTGVISGAGTNAIWEASKSVTNISNLKVIPSNIVAVTNVLTDVVNFAISQGEFTTNANFAFLAPVGVSLTNYQSSVVVITNSLGSLITFTAPANCHSFGTLNVTNVTVASFFNASGRWTNMIARPLW